MRHFIFFLLFASFFIFGLASCTPGKNFQQRHYRPAFVKPAQELQQTPVIHTQTHPAPRVNALRNTDSTAEIPVFKKANVIPAKQQMQVLKTTAHKMQQLKKETLHVPALAQHSPGKTFSAPAPGSADDISTGKLLLLLLISLFALALLGLALLLILAGGWMILWGVLAAMLADGLAFCVVLNNEDHETHKFKSFLSGLINVLAVLVLILVFPVSIVLFLIFLSYGWLE